LTQQAVRLGPATAVFYENLTNDTVALQRFDETRQIIRETQARKLDQLEFHMTLYALASLGEDSAAIAEQQQWLRANPTMSTSDSRLHPTEKLTPVVLARRAELTRARCGLRRTSRWQRKCHYLANAALEKAAYGYAGEARRSAAEALKLAPASPGVEVEAVIAFAKVGDTARSESLAHDLNKRYPLGTQMQALWLPTIHARLALNGEKKNPASAINALQSASAIELGLIPFFNNISCLNSV
jgi:hypothetical protein